MVWKSTKSLGVGKATAADGSTFVVARYLPAGNVTNQGHFENNVLPVKTTTWGRLDVSNSCLEPQGMDFIFKAGLQLSACIVIADTQETPILLSWMDFIRRTALRLSVLQLPVIWKRTFKEALLHWHD